MSTTALHPFRPALLRAAMPTALAVLLAGCGITAAPSAAARGVVRSYFVGADAVDWNYAPTGRNEITGAPFEADAAVYTAHTPGRIGATYRKCLYRAYTDDTFRTLVARPAAEAYLGDLGPTLRATVGDTIRVVFRNACPFPTSMHPHGVAYAKDDEGAAYNDDAAHRGAAVPAGGRYTYTWEVPERAGPGPADGSSSAWMYHSHNDEPADVYAGLTGFLVITARGRARPDATPIDVDREVFSLFEVDDENASPFLDDNVRRFVTGPRITSDRFAESNKKHSINGYTFGGGPMVTLRRGERVRWYLMGMGTEVDLHTPHWHGATALVGGTRTDVVNLLPASMAIADLIPDRVGIWLFHCHVADHIKAGMATRYRVE